MDLHFDCIFYYVSDLERAIHFYTEILGFDLKFRDVVASFEIDGVLVELVPGKRVRGPGNARLCLRVADIESAVADLQAKGVTTSEVETKDGGYLASFHDPDGNEICLWQYAV
jgi:catechol 2,3-dioxygenase-like lactoylglutathione lyase family enzyme